MIKNKEKEKELQLLYYLAQFEAQLEDAGLITKHQTLEVVTLPAPDDENN